MGLLDFLRRRQPEIVVPEASIENSPVAKNAEPGVLIAPAFLDSVPPDRKGAELLASTGIGWVYACASVIAEAVARTEFRLYKVSSKGPVEIDNHPLLDLLYKVNGFTTAYDHIYKSQMFLEGVGEAPWYLARKSPNAVPDSMVLLHPDRLEIKYDSDNIIGGYKYRRSDGSFQEIEAKDIIFLRTPSLTSDFRGMGTLQAAAGAVDTEAFAERWKRDFFYNSARPDFVLQTAQSLNQKVIDRFRKLWEGMFRGVGNAHKMAILDNGLEAKVLGWTQQDMQFVESLRWDRDKILAIFRVPKSIIGITEDVNLASAQAAETTFAKFTVRPRLERLVQQLNEFLCPQFGEGLYFDYDDPTPDNLLDQATYLTAAQGWMTTNEIRAEKNLPPVSGGDVILKPLGLTPAFSLPTPPTKAVSYGERVRALRSPSVQFEIMKSNLVKNLSAAIAADMKIELSKGKDKRKAKVKQLRPLLNAEQREDFQKLLNVKSVARFEDLLKNKMAQTFEKQGQDVLTRLDKLEKAFSPEAEAEAKRLIETLWDNDRAALDKMISDNTYPIIVELIREQALATSKYIDVQVGDVTADAKVAEAIRETNLKLAGSVNDVTRDNILAALAAGVEEGEGINKLRDRVQEVFTVASESRAEMIARSEAIRGSNFAAEEVYKKAGVKVKEWITAMDERTCPFCDSMDGKQVDVGDTYWDKGDSLSVEGQSLSFNYSNIDGPPLHPNCRCTLGPVIEI